MHDEATLAAIIDARPTICPNTYASGCRCVEHEPGLLAYAENPKAYMETLDATRAVRLHVVTRGPNGEPAHTGTYTCQCEDCRGNVASITPKGAGPAAFQVKPARLRAA